MHDESYDVVIVGARIAGSVVAALVGDAGYRVLLIDRDTFPSWTISTHYFRGEFAVTVLKRLGLLDQVLAWEPPPLTHTYTFMNGGTNAIVEGPQSPGEIGYGLSVRREPLDALLVRRTQQSDSVTFADHTRFVDVVRDNDRVVGARLKNSQGERTVRARIVIGADGRNSTVARAVGPQDEVSSPGTRAMYYRYVSNYASPHGGPLDGPEFSFLGDEIAYALPCDHGLTCIAISINLENFKRLRRNAERGFMDQLKLHRGLAERLSTATFEGKLLGVGPQPNFVRMPYGPGWALVGDSAIHQDPWTGRGIDMASVHAAYLGEALIDWFRGASSEEQALGEFHRRRNDVAMSFYRDTVNLGRDLSQISRKK